MCICAFLANILLVLQFEYYLHTKLRVNFEYPEMYKEL